MPGKWQILNGVKYPVEDSEGSPCVSFSCHNAVPGRSRRPDAPPPHLLTPTRRVTNPFFQDGKEWEVIKGLTPEDIMKILKKQQKENKKKEREENKGKKKEQTEGKKKERKQRSLGVSRQNGAGKYWIPE
jgi:hypothetical protein